MGISTVSSLLVGFDVYDDGLSGSNGLTPWFTWLFLVVEMLFSFVVPSGSFGVVMVAPVISISLDSSEESVGSHAPRVILFGTIPAIIPDILVVPAKVPIAPADLIVALEVGAVSVISPTGVLDLVDYSSSSDSDPSEDSLPSVPELPLVSPFLCSDDSEVDNESEPAEQRPERHESLTPSSEFPLVPVVASPGIRRLQRVGPLPAHRLAWRRVFYRSSDRHSSPDSTSGSSSFGLSSDSLSNTSSIHSSGQSHSGPSTRDASPRLVDSSVRTTRCSSSSERSLDSSSPSSGPSRKRCRSPTISVPSSTHVSRSIAPTPADLLPPHFGISEGVGAHTREGIGMGVEVVASDIREYEEEIEAKASAGGTVDIEVDPRVRPTVVEDVPEHTTSDGAVEITYVPLNDLIQRFHDHVE
ncbi:hypothetical protein Tco_1000225 [Tanacetum coccineum]